MSSLYIDTASNKKIFITIDIDGKKREFSYNLSYHVKSEKILNLIVRAISELNINLVSIDRIFVKKGPGSFTGLKVGTSIANALSFCLLIPVNNKPFGSIETPSY